jgi:hypothetical protein
MTSHAIHGCGVIDLSLGSCGDSEESKGSMLEASIVNPSERGG